jgi:hypothetical protein
LPETIAKLKKVKKVWLYGSNLKRIPPEIGEMESLAYFDLYTSYDLHWFPYEIVNCRNLKDSRVSTRALYRNYKNRMGFPDLTSNPVRYEGHTVKCNICKKELSWQETNQLWVSLWVGIDVLPLLANVCSTACENSIPASPEDYIPNPHKGGVELKQSLNEDELFELEMIEWEKEEQLEKEREAQERQEEYLKKKPQSPQEPGAQYLSIEPKQQENPSRPMQLIKFIRKIWER